MDAKSYLFWQSCFDEAAKIRKSGKVPKIELNDDGYFFFGYHSEIIGHYETREEATTASWNYMRELEKHIAMVKNQERWEAERLAARGRWYD